MITVWVSKEGTIRGRRRLAEDAGSRTEAKGPLNSSSQVGDPGCGAPLIPEPKLLCFSRNNMAKATTLLCQVSSLGAKREVRQTKK